jgi:prevent-host-death family protein
MKRLSTFDAKNKFSRVLRDAASGEPTIITRNGEEYAAVISIAEFRESRDKKPNFVEFLLKGPLRGTNIEFERSKDIGRPPIDFSE